MEKIPPSSSSQHNVTTSDTQIGVPENDKEANIKTVKTKTLLAYHYYYALSFLPQYRDVTTFLQVNKKCKTLIETLPYYLYTKPHPSPIFPKLLFADIRHNVSAKFLQELIMTSKKLVSLRFVIGTENCRGVNKLISLLEKSQTNFLKNIKLTIESKLNINNIISRPFLNIETLIFDWLYGYTATTFNTNLKSFDITLSRSTDLCQLVDFFSHFFCKRIVVRVEYEAFWDDIRFIAKKLHTRDCKLTIFTSHSLISESPDLDEMNEIPSGTIVVLKGGDIYINGFICHSGEIIEDHLKYYEGSNAATVLPPLFEVNITGNSYRRV
ncbi:hypothetical protein EIN_021310 [Entamoeba invadens IP1]|uniref:hypothetical protein n=1 Tax=Entamoeba invadens IP1 TaxID=370355 RepID=UPI0002C3EE7E|nr:hypothetical protein EIN_021310 [Entamoeba invadens IP1]ELP90612.1 hypothetical protein EIN_021310 [Entamoeba invadens IP1]|eukprot:XP_004257383.1 hypothetical protein EIN_021310 [Entamoeba invadens IP1]